MGRIISPSEHRMSGIVSIDRPLNPNIVLTVDLIEKQEQAMARIADIKRRAQLVGHLVAEQNSIITTEIQIKNPVE